MASKEEVRKRCRSRKIANPLYRSRIINKTLLPLLSNSRRILIYHPLPKEVDILPLIKALRRRGKELYFPVVEGEELRMVKYGLPLERGRWGWAPAGKNPRRERIDLAIVPIIGTDPTLRRIGFGKGFYDRFFQKLGYRPQIIFLQLSPCISREVVTDSWDVEGDLLVSFNFRVERRNRDGRLSGIGGGYRSWRFFNRPMARLSQI